MSDIIKNWTWEKAKEGTNGIWVAGSPVPDFLLARGDLAKLSKTAFEHSPTRLFEPLQALQPNVWRILTEAGEPLCLTQDKKYPILQDFVKVFGDLVVYFNPFTISDDLIDWDKIFLALPNFLHGYYRYFNGMHASYLRSNGPKALNLPGDTKKWRRVSDYQKENNLKKKAIAEISKKLGDPENIDIFLETEWKDLFMLNLNTNDQEVYVAPQGNFDEFFALKNAALHIDLLCTHVISGLHEPYYMSRFR